MSLRAVFASAVAALLLGCSDSTGPDLTPIPPPPAHVYVADLNGRVYIFNAPLTNASVPSDSIVVDGLGVAVDDSGSLAVSGFSKWVYLYHHPVTGSSTPSDSVASNPFYGFSAFGPDRRLYVGTQGPHVLVYTPPFTHTSVPDTIKNGITFSYGTAFDRQQRLYVSDPSGKVHVYDPPYTGAEAFRVDSGMGSIQGLAIDASGRLLVAMHSFDKILIYAPPLSATSTPVDSVTVGLKEPEAMAIGGDGYLYVANANDSSIVVFHPPFTHSSTPAVTIHAGMQAPWGVAVGK